MTTARALLRRLLRQGRLDPGVPTEAPASKEPAAGQRLDEARQRLKQTIPPPEDPNAGRTIPPPEGVSPEEESPPVP